MTLRNILLAIVTFLLPISAIAFAEEPVDRTKTSVKAAERKSTAKSRSSKVNSDESGVPYLLDGEPAFGRVGYLADSLKVLKIIDGRQLLVRAYRQHHTEGADGKPVTLHVPILLVLRGLSTAGLEVGSRPEIAGIFEVTTDYRAAEYFDPAPVLEAIAADWVMPSSRKPVLRR